jgi:hypothetical protein
MLNDWLSWIKKKYCCKHYRGTSVFWDLHRGADDEIYVRSNFVCPDCGWTTCNAVRLPDMVSKAIDEKLFIGTLEER